MNTRISTLTKKFSGLLSDTSLTKKASLNALASFLDYGARWLVTFIINPMLVHGLGDFGYGAWQVLGRLIGYISPAGGQPTQALKWTIANQQASTDYDAKRQQVGSAVTIWFIFLPLLSVLGGVITWFIPSWIDTPITLIPSIRWAAAFLVANLIFTNLFDIPPSVLRGENLGYKRMGLTTMLEFLIGILVALALYFKAGIAGVALANLIATIITGVVFFKLAKSYVAWFGIAKPMLAQVKVFLGLSWWFLAWNLVMQLLKAGDVVLLGIFDSAELVTHYSLTRYIPETIIGVIAIVVFGITPGLGGIIGRGDLNKANRVRGEIMTLTWLIVTVFGSTMLLWNRSFVNLWVGNQYYAGTLSNLLIIVMVSQFVFIRNDANIIDLTLNLKSKVLMGLLSAAVSGVISGILVGVLKLGINGLTLAFIVGQSVLTIGYPVIIGRRFSVPLSEQLKGALRPALITLVLFGSIAYLGNYLTVFNWPSLVLSVGATAGLLALLVFFVGISSEQRKSLLGRIRKVIPF